jgi:hypothetical protein
MKKLSRKLNLNRETLIPLTSDTLDGINGGITPGTITPHTTTTGPSVPQTRLPGLCDPTRTRFFCPQSQTSVPR